MIDPAMVRVFGVKALLLPPDCLSNMAFRAAEPFSGAT
jgi:hypothetical protein